MKINSLEGLTFTSVERVETDHEEAINFICDDGRQFSLFHSQDCCESVYIDDICGDLADIAGSPITLAEEVKNYSEDDGTPEPPTPVQDCDRYTWSFYKLSTNKGSVTIRFFGTSNGYYSETADLHIKEYSVGRSGDPYEFWAVVYGKDDLTKAKYYPPKKVQ